MYFRYKNITEVIFHDLKDRGEVVLQPSKDYQVTLRSLTEEELKVVQLYYMSAYSVTLICEKEAPHKVKSMFESLAQNRLPEGTLRTDSDQEFFDADGMLKSEHFDENSKPKPRLGIPVEVLPKPFQVFAERLIKELDDYAINFIKILRWRGNGSGPNRPIKTTAGIEWSLDKAAWYLLPRAAQHTTFEHTSILQVTDGVRADVESFVGNEIREPLGHELLYEAWSQRPESPRSALILGIAAAEVGLKNCIASLVPNSEWLVSNLQSPPIERMLQEYLPKLPAKCNIKGKVLPPPLSVMAELKKGITLRNQAVHGKADSLQVRNTERHPSSCSRLAMAL